MLQLQTLPEIRDRYLNLITIQSKALDQNGLPEETLVVKHSSDDLLSLQEVRKAYWEKRWTHQLVEHIVIDAVNRNNEF